MPAQWMLTDQGDMYFPTSGSGADAITTDPATCANIKIAAEFGLVKGEWTLDTNVGFPWMSIWGQKNPNVFSLKQLFRKTLFGIKVGMLPVASIEDLNLLYDSALRDTKYNARVKLANGQVVTVPGTP
jgi:hypothetical protein